MMTTLKTAAGGARFPVLVVLSLTAAALASVPVLDAEALRLATQGTITDMIDHGSIAFVKGILAE